MAEHPHQALPGLPFFLPQGAAQIGDHDKVMRLASLPKCRTANNPAARLPEKTSPESSRRFSLQTFSQAQIFRALSQKALGILRHHALASAVHQPQLAIAVKGKYSDVNFSHHRGETCA